EDNGMAGRSPADQERIGQALEDLGMTMGVFVAHANLGKPTFASDDAELWKGVEQQLRNSVEVAERVNAKWCTLVPGSLARRAPMEYQTARVVDNLRRAADILEPGGLIAVLEPLNPFTDHPGCFLTGIPQAYMICRAVNRPSIKILDDLYHQQITEGNLIPNIDKAWDEIAYFQVGDNPGRKEPTTGEINYRNVFRHIARKGFDGIVGMEHGNSLPGKEGERALINAYRSVDDF
ncbi:MAG: TIM barrel protein, partial [Planctomycetota bacterium]|nr:TIM barrel protein [Planctomycetota bacterium]